MIAQFPQQNDLSYIFIPNSCQIALRVKTASYPGYLFLQQQCNTIIYSTIYKTSNRRSVTEFKH